MTDWAEKKVEDLWYRGHQHVDDMSELLRQEHQRAVRIVRAEIERVKKDQHTYHSEERCLILGSLETVLAALERGRTRKG